MRALVLALALAAVTGSAAAEPANSRAAYVERRGMLEADGQCHIFRSDIRAALEVGAAQARGALLREGWTLARLADLDRAVVDAAHARPCNDPRTASAAAAARSAFASWTNVSYKEFPGWQRMWLARRVVGANGWRLSQAIDAPFAAVFGVRDQNAEQHLVLLVPVGRGEAQPTSAHLIMRDTSRAQLVEISLPQRMAEGLEAGAPAPMGAFDVAGARYIEPMPGGGAQIAFVFPDSAFGRLLALDPRESVVLRVQNGRVTQDLLVEVADVAAARRFLTLR